MFTTIARRSVSTRVRRRLRRVAAFAPEAVTTASDHEVDPRSVGVHQQDVDAIWGSVKRLYRFGLHPSMSLHIRRRGRVLVDRAIGHARGNGVIGVGEGPLVQATPESRYNLFSASKSVLAMLVHLMDERGRLDIDHRVVRYIPEFAPHGKDRITLRHVLCHRAGIPVTTRDMIDLDTLEDTERILEMLCEARPLTPAGASSAYHAVSGGFLLAEVLRRVTGRGLRALLKQEIVEPLGLRHFTYGVDRGQEVHVAEEAFTGPREPLGTGKIFADAMGVTFPEAVELANDARFLNGVVPSGNLIATASDVGRFFEMLLRGGRLDGVRLFDPGTIRRATAPANGFELDDVIRLPIRYSPGFMLGGQVLSFYGQGTSRAFGHLGFSNVLAWADPERDISVAFLSNGKPFLTPEVLAWLNVMRTISGRIPRDARAA